MAQRAPCASNGPDHLGLRAVQAATDIDCFAVRSKDARRYILRQPLAQAKLQALNEWRQRLFQKRMQQWGEQLPSCTAERLLAYSCTRGSPQRLQL